MDNIQNLDDLLYAHDEVLLRICSENNINLTKEDKNEILVSMIAEEVVKVE